MIWPTLLTKEQHHSAMAISMISPKSMILYNFSSPQTPPPGSYENNDFCAESKKKDKGFGFGSGRSQMETTGFIPKNYNPGPGTYNPSPTKSTSYFSLKGKIKADNR